MVTCGVEMHIDAFRAYRVSMRKTAKSAGNSSTSRRLSTAN